MSKLNRSVEPAIREIEDVEIIRAKPLRLANGIPLYSIQAGTQDLCRIELLFPAGFINQGQPLVASTVNELIDEGTHKRSAQQLADAIDYYGAFLETEITPDFASVNLFTLNKHLPHVVPVLEEIIKEASFPQQELEVNIQNRKQKFLVSQQKVNDVARKKFNQLVFGNGHPYGYFVELEDFDRLRREHLLDFYHSFYSSGHCRIIISGKVSESSLQLIEKHFGGKDWAKQAGMAPRTVHHFHATNERTNLVLKEDALQSAIRIGRQLFTKTHEDFLPMQVLNTVLGGYFGSRLMANIREDKGYTYGIGSGVLSYREAGCFFISTEVGVNVTKNAVNEIFSEIRRLREEPVGEDELALVRNYMLGSFISSVDGPFALADRFKGILVFGLDYDYYDKYLHTVRTITSEQLRDLANRYWQEQDLIELVVGRKE
ncbi:MAG: pitrilysin family protein [Bacteroidota bacterium]